MAIDVNPSPDPWRRRATTIMGADPLPEEAEALLPLGEECGLSARRAAAHMRRIADALDEWRTAARRNGIREQEITMMAESIDARLQAVRVAAS